VWRRRLFYYYFLRVFYFIIIIIIINIDFNCEYSCTMFQTEPRGWALDRVHNSRRPLDRIFALCDPDPMTLTLTFDLILIDGRHIVMDYPRAKSGDCSFSHFDFIVWTDRQTDRQTDTDSNERLTHATTNRDRLPTFDETLRLCGIGSPTSRTHTLIQNAKNTLISYSYEF